MGDFDFGQPQDYYQASGHYTSPTVSILPSSSSSSSPLSTLGSIFNFLGAASQLYSSYVVATTQKDVARTLTSASRLASDLNMQSRAEQQAMNASQAASERRQQLREERVKRGKLIQASTNSGVSYSSGELGGTSALSTQKATNLGTSFGMFDAATRASNDQQQAANVMGAAENQARAGQLESSIWSGIGGLGSAIFQGTGGFTSLFGNKKDPFSQAPAPVETR
jgi:hypothetical protein